jgi:hypothetical protein
MAYLLINGHDYSSYVNELKVSRAATYRAQTNAAGNTVVDNTVPKREIEIGIIPLSSEVMANLLTDVYSFEVILTYRNPRTNALEQVHCIVPESNIEYYTIQSNRVLYNAFNLTFVEL